jgi:hypothetical protein
MVMVLYLPRSKEIIKKLFINFQWTYPKNITREVNPQFVLQESEWKEDKFSKERYVN